MADLTFVYLSIPVFLLNAAIFAYNFVKTLQTYKVKQKKSGIFLLLLFSGCAFISICSAIDGILYYPGVIQIRIGYSLSLLGNIVATIGLLYFATEVFSSGEVQKSMNITRIAYSCVFGAICIWGTYELFTAVPNVIPLGLLFMLNLMLYTALAISAYRTAGRVEEDLFKTSIKYIGHYAIVNAVIYVFYILDGMDSATAGLTAYGFIGAIVFCFTAYLAYVGFVKPMKARESGV